jgi:hypothetical protein
LPIANCQLPIAKPIDKIANHNPQSQISVANPKSSKSAVINPQSAISHLSYASPNARPSSGIEL